MSHENNNELADTVLIELIDEGLAAPGADYWDQITDSLDSLAKLDEPDAPTDLGDYRALPSKPRRGLGFGPLLTAAALLLITGISWFMTRPDETTTSVEVFAQQPTVVPEIATHNEDVEDTTNAPDPSPVEVSTEAPVDVPAGFESAHPGLAEQLLAMFDRSNSSRSDSPILGDGRNWNHPVHELDPQMEPSRCSWFMSDQAYVGGLYHFDIATPGQPETLLLAFESPGGARATNETYLDAFSMCYVRNTSERTVTAITPAVDVFGSGFEMSGVVVDADFRDGQTTRTIHLVHDRFIGRVTLSAEEPPLTDQALRVAADNLVAMLTTGEPSPSINSDFIAFTDRGESVVFADDARWLASCATESRSLSLLYASGEYLDLVEFAADVETGVYGPDNPAPPQLLQALDEITVPFDGASADNPVRLPNPPSSVFRIMVGFDGLGPAPSSSDAGSPSGRFFLIDSQGQPWISNSVSSSDDAGEFAPTEMDNISFVGEPCVEGSTSVTFSVNAVLPEEYSPRADWVQFVATDVTVELR